MASKENSPTKNNGHKNMIALKLLRVSGKSATFYFSPHSSASDIAKHVFMNWPQEWEEESVDTADVLRLIYQGRFLHGNATLGALKLSVGKTTVMHIVSRETLPEQPSQEKRSQEKTTDSGCHICCVIL